MVPNSRLFRICSCARLTSFKFCFFIPHFSTKYIARMNSFDTTANESKGKVFVQKFNPIRGIHEWDMENEDYDYSKEVANSAYADMLHDDERNKLYYDAIHRAVATLRSRGDSVRVLDIGTGTGLLSMMAAQCGADCITACEAFKPMASCAEKILASNGFSEKVRVVHKRSTELVVGEDLLERANLLVAELFDTELIGEGAIGTYDHARQHLLTEDAVLVPSGAQVFAQVVSSEFLASCNIPYRRKPAHCAEFQLPSWLATCPGSTSLHDLQLSQLSPDLFTAVSEPLCVFSFDWSGRDIPLTVSETVHVDFIPNRHGAQHIECHAVLMWWRLTMDEAGDIVLSCAPHWAETNSSYAWRDHWMQAIYHLPSPLITLPGDGSSGAITLNAARDDYSMWFTLSQSEKRVRPAAPHCMCGQHIVNPRTRLLQLADAERLDVLTSVLDSTLAQHRPCAWLVLGDASNVFFVGRLASHANVHHVYIHESIQQSRRLLLDFLELNGLKKRVTILPEDLSIIPSSFIKFEIGVVFAEPHFIKSLLPWHNARLSCLLRECRHLLPPASRVSGQSALADPSITTIASPQPSLTNLSITTTATLLPACFSIHVMAVSFDDLWKIRAPCQQRCGFNLEIFDEMVDCARSRTGEVVEPQPLWEYPCYALHDPVEVTKLYMREDLNDLERHFAGKVELDMDKLSSSDSSRRDRIKRHLLTERNDERNEPELFFNGVAVWADWHFVEKTLSTGPITRDGLVGKKVLWNKTCQQGVHLLRRGVNLLAPAPDAAGRPSKVFHYSLDVTQGQLLFSFHLGEA